MKITSFFIKLIVLFFVFSVIPYRAISYADLMIPKAETAQEKKEEVIQDLEKQIDITQKNLAELKAQLKKSKSSAKKNVQSQVDELEKKEEKIKKDLSDLKKSSGKAWEHLKEGLSAALSDLKTSYKKAKEEFSKSNKE